MTTITFDAGELRRLLANGILFAADPKDMLPVIECVRFDWDGDQLYAVATNRYVLSWELSTPKEQAGHTPFSVPVADAKRIVAALKAGKKTAGFAQDATLEYETPNLTFRYSGTSMTFEVDDAEFIRWQGRRDGYGTGTKQLIAFAQEWLTRLAKVEVDTRRGDHIVHFAFSEYNKPAVVTIGERFHAIIAPVPLAVNARPGEPEEDDTKSEEGNDAHA